MKKLSIIVSLTGFMATGAMAQLLNVDQEVFGMDCAPCAYGLERGLKKLDGLEKVQVSLNDGKAYVSLAAENELTLRKIQEEVKQNGFSARNAEVTLKGELRQQGNFWQINVHNETFQLASDTDPAVTSVLSPGPITVKGIVPDEEDKHLDNTWKIRVTEIL